MSDSFDRLHRIGYPPGLFTSPETFSLQKYEEIKKAEGDKYEDAFRTGDYKEIIQRGEKKHETN